MKTAEPQTIEVIERWFKARCDGLWEHHHGLRLETADNPGWLLTIDEPIEEAVFKELSTDIRARWNAECVREESKTEVYGEISSPPPVQVIKLKKDRVKVYAVSLTDCLSAAAHILTALRIKN